MFFNFFFCLIRKKYKILYLHFFSIQEIRQNYKNFRFKRYIKFTLTVLNILLKSNN